MIMKFVVSNYHALSLKNSESENHTWTFSVMICTRNTLIV